MALLRPIKKNSKGSRLSRGVGVHNVAVVINANFGSRPFGPVGEPLVGKGGEPLGLADHHPPEPQEIRTHDELQVVAGVGAEVRLDVLAAPEAGGQGMRVVRLGDELGDHGPEQGLLDPFLLPTEVRVHGLPRHPGVLGDLLEGRALEPVLEEDLEGCVEHGSALATRRPPNATTRPRRLLFGIHGH